MSNVGIVIVSHSPLVAEGTADDPTHQLQFAGHIRQIEHVTLVAERDGAVVGNGPGRAPCWC